ncbi:hypothetical protein WJX73_001120 [Symbiochloris irregularis]|uniref:Uncharacterized protein n=1 Tax=Symbiochloris irregularis TaxID=706552 RepID=A0AAW1NR50_9CHLO
MELDDSRRYAAAALFTMALHSTQTESGVAGQNPFASDAYMAWGHLPDSEMAAFLSSTADDPAADAAWDAFWGFDCVAADGLCERAYEHLCVPKTSWPGLKQLPQVVEESQQKEMVQQFLDLLDQPFFSKQPLPSIPNLPPKPAAAPDPSQIAPLEEDGEWDEEDEDIKADIRRPSSWAMAALTELLAACIADHHMPTLQDMLKDAQDRETGKKSKKKRERRQAAVRWYDARARVSLRRLSVWLVVPWDRVATFECLFAESANQRTRDTPQERTELSAAQKRMKYLKIGAAAVGGGALLAVTGGLAAPALAAVAGTAITVMGGSAAAAGALTGFLGSTVGAATLIGGLGAGGAYGAGGRMAKRVGEVTEFGFLDVPDDAPHATSFAAEPIGQEIEFPELDEDAEDFEQQRPLTAESSIQGSEAGQPGGTEHLESPGGTMSQAEEPGAQLLPIPVSSQPKAAPRLSVVIGVAGWVSCKDDFVGVWQHAGDSDCERFALVWETEELIKLNSSLAQFALALAKQKGAEWLANAVVHGVMAAIALPYTAWRAVGLVSSQWALVLNRAARAGELLAHVLMSGAHGGRPVTLIGYSMGARLIYHCLLELARCRCKGAVEHAVMLGTPVVIVPDRYALARSVVAGRCINAYSENDWVLSLNFRARSGLIKPPAGVCPVPVVGIENVDLSEHIDGHQAWARNMDAVLDVLGFS